jgi:glycine reductase complex component B subunit alpha and beta
VSSSLADLVIATFAVDGVVEGTKTGRDGGTLVVAVPELAVGAGEPALAEATVDVVRPGDRVRIANVLDAVLPDIRADDPATTFPRIPGTASTGSLRRLAGVAVISVCDWRGAGHAGPEEFPDSFVDMDGPGADRSPWGATSNVVLRFVPRPGTSVEDVDAAIRRETLRVARELAATTTGHEPGSVQRYGELPRGGDLPALAAILQIASEGPLVDTFWYGEPARWNEPRVVDPREVLGGALTSGAYDWPSVRTATATYQDSALIRALYAGDRARFAGLILAPGYLDTAEEKQRSAEASARLARELGAAGVICTTFSSGNSHTDTMLTVRECERAGIAATAIVAETNGGLTDHVPEATSIVSAGNEDELVAAWTPDRVIGSEGPAHAGEPVPTWAYLSATVQTGDGHLQAVPA